MAALPASVIVVSRHRPEALQRCLMALFQQDHPDFELIVIADPQAAAAAEATLRRFGQPARVQAFDEANISAARNLGLIRAAGQVVAFIDDDAVAEPSWLSRLTAAFADPAVTAATGFVRGRNGISYQWRAAEVDRMAQDHPLDIAAPSLRQGSPVRAVKTTGTNCAFRLAPLLAIGGFDPALRFYLDEADVNLRLADFGPTAIIPAAEVQHGFAASARRTANRIPLSLHDIAASTAVFLRRHAPGADMAAAWQTLHWQQGERLARLRSKHRLGAAAEQDLQRSLTEGWADGLTRALSPLEPLLPLAGLTHLPLQGTGPRPGTVIAGRVWQAWHLHARARDMVAAGHIVSVICLAPSPRRHRVEFTADGYWLQTGGLFGQSERSGPKLRLNRFSTRIRQETARIALQRPIK